MTVSALCAAERHTTCAGLTYTGCTCTCHPPEHARVALQVPTSAEGPSPPRSVLPPTTGSRRAARAGSWLLLLQGAVVLVLGAALIVTASSSSPTGGEAGLAQGLEAFLGAMLVPYGLSVGAMGAVARGPGILCPLVGLAMYTPFPLVLLLTGPALLALESVLVELALLVTVSLGLRWWRFSSRFVLLQPPPGS